ncbi:MAG TPA: hypothetical protein VGB42_11590 [Candidatus Thermoplasmatota archaeon]
MAGGGRAVVRGGVAPRQEEAAAIRLRLEVGIAHEDALAVVRAGYLTAAEVAAADDDEFVRAVRLPRARAQSVLAAARAPGSHARGPGERPRLLREQPVGPAVARATGPVRRAVVKALGEPAPAAEEPTGPKPAPPHAASDRARRRRLRDEAAEAERDLDAALEGRGGD